MSTVQVMTHQARRILRRLGFTASRHSAPTVRLGSGTPSRSGAEFVELLRAHIGEWVAVKDYEVLVAATTPAAVLAWLSQHDQTADTLFRVPESEAAAGGADPA